VNDHAAGCPESAVRNVIAMTAISQDARDWEAHAACFAPDARYSHPKGEIIGVPAIIERSTGALSRLDRSQHLIGTVHVVVDGDRAESTAYFVAQHVREAAEGGRLYVIAGTYRDALALMDGEWRITHRRQEYSWRDGNPEVIIRD
jgi:3-phenylpropionate/cinnamic acid dioxygenase small subunit